MTPSKLDAAYSKCSDLAYSHYENFPVAKMVPKKLRKHVAAVYAFARTADDIADEQHETLAADDPIRVERLREFESQLDISGESGLDPRWDWIFLALSNTIKEFGIPKQLFRDLISAFAQDVVKKRYATFEEVLDYCRRSANPVGRLVLILHNIKDQKLFGYSDDICTALQLANFWQDMSVDRLKNRIYIPKEDWGNIGETEIFAESASDAVKELVKMQVDRTDKLFDSGERLVKHLPFPLSLEIKITISGGRSILRKIRKLDYDTLSERPSLNSFDKIKLLISALLF